ncbi:MAG: hypothetical protein IKW21_05780 [Lachnospiraceae bacterium]|nr:hypothetical protein [Lachnospiraceae bacterium]
MEKKYDNTNRGTLFRDENRRNDRSPEYTGTINVAGKDYRLSAWIKESKTGKKYFSLAISSPQLKKKEEPVQPFEADMIDEELPF